MYVSAKGGREFNAKIALNSFKEKARINRKRKLLGGKEGYLGGGVRKKGASLGPAKDRPVIAFLQIHWPSTGLFRKIIKYSWEGMAETISQPSSPYSVSLTCSRSSMEG
jgi:hypothetical protein